VESESKKQGDALMQENEPDFEKHIDDIVKAIGDKLERNVIANELRRYVDEYGIDLATAKESIVRKHYGNPNELSVGGEKLLAQVGPGENSVSFKAKIVSVYKKEINTKEGSKKTIYEGEIGDSSSKLRYTFWNDEFKFQPNDVVEISNAYTKSWNDIITVNIGDRAIIKAIEDKDLQELDLGIVKNNNNQAGQKSEVVNLKPGMRNVSVKLRVIDVEPRKITIKGEEKTIYGGNIGDQSGTCRFTSWEDHNIVAGKAYLVENAYVKEFNGPDLQFGEYSKFTELEEDDLPSLSDYEAGMNYTLAQLDERNGASDAVIEGHVFNIREGSGLIFRDKETKRLIRNGDDRKNAEPDLRVKMIFDDGSGSCTAYLNREITEKLIGRDLDSCLEFVKENFGPEALVEEMEDALLLKPLKLRGFARSDEYGLSFFAKSCEAASEIDVPNAARQFLAALEG
jgi:replication factor A1